MKKILAIVLAALMLLASAACGKQADKEQQNKGEMYASDLEYIQSKGTLIVGITEYAPMDYKESGSDEWTGFDAEFARAVAEELGVEAQFIEIEWANKFFELDAKGIDCIWNGMTITEEALNNASVSNAYVRNAQVVVMATDKLGSYSTVESLSGLTFAAEDGSAGAAALDENNIKYTAVLTQTDALQEVKSGAADACVIDITMANAMTGEGTSYSNLGYSLELSSEEYGVAFRKGSDVPDFFNEIMNDLKADGTLQALAEKYNLTLA